MSVTSSAHMLPSKTFTNLKSLESKAVVVDTIECDSSTSSHSQSDSEPSANNVQSTTLTRETSPPIYQHDQLALKILHIIETYGINNGGTDASRASLARYLPLVIKQVENEQPIRLLFSGFPFKSPDATDRVLGSHVDLGETLALGHLNSLGSNIEAVYSFGAEIHVLSEGLIYNGESSCFLKGGDQADIFRSMRRG